MRIFCLLSLASLATAAIIPFNGLESQSGGTDSKTDELSPSIDQTPLSLKYRQRRDVSEIATEYLPPNQEIATAASVLGSPDEPQESTAAGGNGYEYRTVKRIIYRQRRDVSEIADEYLPPVVAEIKSEEDPQESAILGDSGYEYKTVRRLRYRQRRDISEIAGEYLPPTEESTNEEVAEIKSEEEPQDSAVLGDSGYEYKTVRRLRYRQRRDASDIVDEYLPPAEETAEEVSEIKSEEEPQESAVLGDSGYEYKTVRRLRYRQRRDISDTADEYLPPVEEKTSSDVAAEIKSEEEPQESTVLGDSGYEYKSVRRLKYRQRRDVSEISNDYLPPVEETTTDAVVEIKSEEEPQYSAVLGESGYEYKIVRRLKYRQRRDISEIADEYLPPAEESTTEEVAEIKSDEDPQQSSVLGDSGYKYKIVRRLKYRQRRDVSEVADEYLPPANESTNEEVAEIKSEEEPQDLAVLGDSGYQYKTGRRLKYRQRRDISEIADEYLPPAEESTTEVVGEIKSEGEPQDSAVLGDSGYQYKTVRRLKYRQRRDVSVTINK